jgi:hypothetical protein
MNDLMTPPELSWQIAMVVSVAILAFAGCFVCAVRAVCKD